MEIQILLEGIKISNGLNRQMKEHANDNRFEIPRKSYEFSILPVCPISPAPLQSPSKKTDASHETKSS